MDLKRHSWLLVVVGCGLLLSAFHPLATVCDSCLDYSNDLVTGLLLLAGLIAALTWLEKASLRDFIRQAGIASVAGAMAWSLVS